MCVKYKAKALGFPMERLTRWKWDGILRQPVCIAQSLRGKVAHA